MKNYAKKYEDYVYFKYDRNNIFHKGLFYIHQYNWLMRNYESDDCNIELYDDNNNKHYIQFNPDTFIISHKKEDIEKILKYIK
jgi:hypothetical protein